MFVAFESKAYIPAESSLETLISFLFVITESLLPYIPAELLSFTFIIFLFSPIALFTKIPTVLSTSRSIVPVFIASPFSLAASFFIYIPTEFFCPTVILFLLYTVVFPAEGPISAYIPADLVPAGVAVPFRFIVPVFSIV